MGMSISIASKLAFSDTDRSGPSVLWRIASRIAAQTYQGTIDGLKSMLIGKLTGVAGAAAKREGAETIVNASEEAVKSESDSVRKNALLNFVISPLYAKMHPYDNVNAALDLLKNSKSLLEKYTKASASESSWEHLFSRESAPELFRKRNDVMFWARPDNYAKLETATNKAETSGVREIDENKFESDVKKLITMTDFFTLDGKKFTPKPEDLITNEDMSFVVHPHSTWAAQFMGNGGKFGIKTGPFRGSHTTTCVNWMQGNRLSGYHIDNSNVYMIVDGTRDPSRDPKWAYVVAIFNDGKIRELSDSQNNHLETDGNIAVNIDGHDLIKIIERLKPHAGGGNQIKTHSDRYRKMLDEGKYEEAKADMLQNPDQSHLVQLIAKGNEFTPEELKLIAKNNDAESLVGLARNQKLYDPKLWFPYIGNPSAVSASLLSKIPLDVAMKLPNATEHAWYVYNDPETFADIEGDRNNF